MIEQELMNLGILFLGAIIGGVIAVRIKQPVLLGLLLIGAIIGPHFLGLVNDQKIIDMMAEIGSILLLFVIGLEFVIPKLAKIGFKALLIGILKVGIIFFITYEVCLLMGLSQQIAIIFGVILSISSTVVIIKILESKGYHERQEMPLLIGVLIMEDIFAVIALTFLSGVKNNTGIFSVFEKLIISITLLLIAYLVMLKVFKIIIPWLVENSSDEMTTFLALGICAGFSYLAYALGLSPATGAFLAGSVVASLPEVKLFEHAIKPYTLTFSSLFFISIGTMTDFSVLKTNFNLLIILVLLVIITRFVAVGFVSYLFANFKRQQMIFSSIAMMSVGEFSLLISKSAMNLNLGIDFVSISAFIIFITALIMSLTINHFQEVTDILISNAPKNFPDKPRSFSNFIRTFSEEIDLDSSHSTTFKKHLFEVISFILYLLFILILGQRIIGFLQAQSLIWESYIVYFVLGVLSLFILYLIYRKSCHMYRILVEILTSLDSAGNKKKSAYLLSNLLLALFLLLITIFSPILIVFFKMPNWINVFSFILLLLVILRFKKLFNYVHYSSSKGNYFPTYKKIQQFNNKI